MTFRAIKPSDEDEMRRLYYRFSDKSIYYRYFSPITTMPHSRMQSYVNIDYQDIIKSLFSVQFPVTSRSVIIRKINFFNWMNSCAVNVKTIMNHYILPEVKHAAILTHMLPFDP